MLSARNIPQFKQNVQPIVRLSPIKLILDRNKINYKCPNTSPDKIIKLSYENNTQIANIQVQTDHSNQQEDHQKKIKKLEVKLGDSQFQLKKITQDFAQYKVISRLQKQKEVRKYRQAFQQIKNKLIIENNLWIVKFQQLKQQHQEQINQIKDNYQSKIQIELKQKIFQKQKYYEQQLNHSKEIYQQKITQILQKKKEIQTKNQKYASQLSIQNEENIILLTRQFKNKLAKYIEQKDQQIMKIEKSHKEILLKNQYTIQTLKNTKNILYQDIHSIKQSNLKLQSENQQYRQNVLNLQKQLKQKTQEVQLLCIKLKEDSRYYEQIKNQQLKSLQQFNIRTIQNLKSQHLQTINILENKIKDIQTLKDQIVIKWQDGYRQLAKKYDQRLSKIEDIEKIKHLNGQLIRKENQNQILIQELKKCRLEQENNQKNYNKIFSTCKHSEKKIYESKDPFARYIHTLDLKSIFKANNK